MIFQDPMMALNPVFTIGWQIAEPLRAHFGLSQRAARDRAVELLGQVAAFPAPSSGSTSIRTICPAACASAS